MRSVHFATKWAPPVLRAGMALVLLGLAPAVGRASIIIGNLTGAVNSSNQSINNNNWYAASFTMGSQAYTLSDVQITLSNPQVSTIFTLQSNATLPLPPHPSGTDVATFTNPPLTGGATATTYLFNAASAFTLAPNTTYWLVGRTNAAATQWVRRNNAPLNPIGSGATFGTYALSGNAGSTWSNDSPSTSPIFQLDGTPSATGVPEPSSLVLVGTVACVALAVGWRRWRTRRPEPTVVTARSS